jgi:phosphopantetheine adenylyltransferase
MSSKSTIAFIPGAFRPFGQHHMSMIDQYAKKCDKVVIIISNPQSEEAQRTTCDGNTICAKDAKSIIDLCISDSGLENVSCDISNDENPIKTILKKIAHLNNCDVILGVSQKDNDIRRYSDIDRDFFSDNNVQILPPEETAVKPYEGDFISASDIREHITDKSLLKTYLPVSIEDETFNKIYDILNSKKCEKNNTDDEFIYNS